MNTSSLEHAAHENYLPVWLYQFWPDTLQPHFRWVRLPAMGLQTAPAQIRTKHGLQAQFAFSTGMSFAMPLFSTRLLKKVPRFTLSHPSFAGIFWATRHPSDNKLILWASFKQCPDWHFRIESGYGRTKQASERDNKLPALFPAKAQLKLVVQQTFLFGTTGLTAMSPT